MRQPLSVLVYPVRPVEGRWEYLLLQRAPSPRLGLARFWQGVTGGLEEGESLVQAARRELREETGLVPSKLEQIEYSCSFPVQDEWRQFYPPGTQEIVEHVFIAFIDGKQEPTLSREHEGWRWCSADEALELLTYPENIEALKRCDSLLEARKGARECVASHNRSL